MTLYYSTYTTIPYSTFISRGRAGGDLRISSRKSPTLLIVSFSLKITW